MKADTYEQKGRYVFSQLCDFLLTDHFKWLKQHLRIKEFYGTSENAVKIQIYAAIIAYCLVVIVQECMGLKLQTYDVLRILSTALLTKMPLCDLLVEQKEEESTEGKYQQLCLNFDG